MFASFILVIVYFWLVALLVAGRRQTNVHIVLAVCLFTCASGLVLALGFYICTGLLYRSVGLLCLFGLAVCLGFALALDALVTCICAFGL